MIQMKAILIYVHFREVKIYFLNLPTKKFHGTVVKEVVSHVVNTRMNHNLSQWASDLNCSNTPQRHHFAY